MPSRRAVLTVIPLLVLPGPGPSAPTHAASPLRYDVDASHSSVSFTVRHLGLSRVRGTFGSVSGSLVLDPGDVTRSSLTMVVRTETLDTGNESRDRDLRANYFDVEEHPVAVFRSRAVRRAGEGLLVEGDLTMKDVTRPVEVTAEPLGAWEDPDSRTTRVGFTGTLRIDRNDFGVHHPGSAAELNFVISDEVTIDIELEGVRTDPAGFSFDDSGDPSLGKRLYETLGDGGPEALRAALHAVTAEAEGVNGSERELLILALRILWDGEPGLAADAAASGLRLHPGSRRLSLVRAEALLESGRSGPAAEILREVLEQDPVSPTALELLRRAESSGGSPPHSLPRAWAGSRRVARHAGTRQATRDTATVRTTADPRATGSLGPTS